MRRLVQVVMFTAVCTLMATTLFGCNTIRGVGRDIQAGGRAIERAAQH